MADIRITRTMARAIHLAVVDTGCTGPGDLITRVASMEQDAVAAILRHWDMSWRDDSTATRMRLPDPLLDYLFGLTPSSGKRGPNGAAGGIAALVDMVRAVKL